ncbi:DUF1102 domain-containing protein [Natrarchaeobius halalkaliphilus]|uniref:DUF1102 domain-containing protein n=1 Tax=Natrarchaeobius halalkaliphilus TaxID=1679091 RepID=A0A3N6LJU6_9EURY|nr:DUF1102 domain-containing protein [Natrarchaeobius halalkaliphilus]RQG88828.1 DUF1102 domain-containing protein [Natrarchaeobius halalkaliphilus]
MQRRKFLIGTGSTAIGASAIIGSGAFSRVEADRSLTVAAADDPDAYLGLVPLDTPNSNAYVELDANGHLEIDIATNENDGEGVNSNSITWFDGMFEICNQGTADADVYIEDIAGLGEDPGEVSFYTGTGAGDGDAGLDFIVGETESINIAVGTCEEIGVRVNSAEEQSDPVFDDDVTIIADSPDAGEPENGNG